MPRQTVTYDPAVIQEFADRLYQQARYIVITSCLKGLVIGLLIGGVIGGAVQFALVRAQQAPYSSPISTSFDAVWIAALIVAALGAISGISRGREKSFKLRLEAQSALCQVQIEKNTGRVGS